MLIFCIGLIRVGMDFFAFLVFGWCFGKTFKWLGSRWGSFLDQFSWLMIKRIIVVCFSFIKFTFVLQFYILKNDFFPQLGHTSSCSDCVPWSPGAFYFRFALLHGVIVRLAPTTYVSFSCSIFDTVYSVSNLNCLGGVRCQRWWLKFCYLDEACSVVIWYQIF